jgi:Ca2+-transporting ATPase
VRGDPTEGALVVAAAKAGRPKRDLERRRPRTGEIPFTSERKRMTTIHGAEDGPFALSKGAAEVILSSCSRIRDGDGTRLLRDDDRREILSVEREMGSRALRVLAVARGPADAEETGREWTLLGLIGLQDPVRAEAKEAVATCARAGIRPIMITGDHSGTARAIALDLGILRSEEGLLTGPQLDRLSDAELAERIPTIDVLARVSPSHKLRIVESLQRAGEIPAMTGDGVNDAPALKKAAVGVAMGIAGTDVAKGAATVILTDDNFATIVAAVEEGRAIFDNVRKYLMYLLSSNTGEILLMGAAVALGLPLPLTAVQILYVNLATDGLPALALAVDPHEPDLMRRRPRTSGTGLLTLPVVLLILAGGVWSAIVNLALFAWALRSGRPMEESVTMTFASLVVIQFFKAYVFRSDRTSSLKSPFANRWLNLAVLWETALLAAILFLPGLSRAFGARPLSLPDWAIILGAGVTIIPVLEGAKAVRRRMAGD